MRTMLILLIATAASALAAAHISSSDVVQFTADPIPAYADQHFASFTVTRVQLAEILDSYREVSGEVWRHRYAHVQGGDRTGTIFLKNGQKLKWLVRPGGLATLTGSDGVTHYLARELPRPNHAMQRTAACFHA